MPRGEILAGTPTFGEAFVRRATIMRALKISVIVGSILSAINQWEALLGEANFNVIKVVLTYLVPFFVSSYSTAASLSDQFRLFEEGSEDEAAPKSD